MSCFWSVNSSGQMSFKSHICRKHFHTHPLSEAVGFVACRRGAVGGCSEDADSGSPAVPRCPQAVCQCCSQGLSLLLLADFVQSAMWDRAEHIRQVWAGAAGVCVPVSLCPCAHVPMSPSPARPHTATSCGYILEDAESPGGA